MPQEWEQEEFAETSSEVTIVMHHVMHCCQHKDPLLWPKAVTAAFESATVGKSSHADDVLLDLRSTSGTQARTTPPTDPGSNSIFVQLGICSTDQ